MILNRVGKYLDGLRLMKLKVVLLFNLQLKAMLDATD